jgi:HAMP domain-containing protein
MNWGQAKQLSIHRNDIQKTLIYTGSSSREPGGHYGDSLSLFTVAMQRIAEGNPFFVSSVLRQGEIDEHLRAYAPVFDSEQNCVAIVEVVIPANIYSATLDRIFIQSLWSSAALLLVGTLLALVISRIINSKISKLMAAAKSLTAGDYKNVSEAGAIREINDLGNTFNTMNSILNDNHARLKVVQSGNDIVEKESDLAVAYNKAELKTQNHQFRFGRDTLEIAGSFTDPKDHQNFYDVIDRDSTLYIVIGKLAIQGVRQGLLERSAVRRLYRHEFVAMHRGDSTFEKVSGLFSLEEWRCLEIDRGQDESQVFYTDYIYSRSTGKLDKRTALLRPNEPILIGSSSQNFKFSKLISYVTKLPDKNPSLVRDELMPILSFQRQAATFVVGLLPGETR